MEGSLQAAVSRGALSGMEGWAEGRTDGEASSSWVWNGSGTRRRPSETLLSLAPV